MLSFDMIKEIALIADYNTTLNILTIFPKLDQFWKRKCIELYPNKTYLRTFSGRENYLIKERTFMIALNSAYETLISNFLIEYQSALDQCIKAMRYSFNNYSHLIVIDIAKQFVVIKRVVGNGWSILFQTDIKDECITVIKEDIEKSNQYYIIDMNEFTFLGSDLNTIRYVQY